MRRAKRRVLGQSPPTRGCDSGLLRDAATEDGRTESHYLRTLPFHVSKP